MNEYMLTKAWKKFKVFDDMTEVKNAQDFGDDVFFMLKGKYIDWES